MTRETDLGLALGAIQASEPLEADMTTRSDTEGLLREALGELLAACIREERPDVYVCRVCGTDVSKTPFSHDPECEWTVVNAWFSATPPDTDPSEWTDERYARGWGQDTDPSGPRCAGCGHRRGQHSGPSGGCVASFTYDDDGFCICEAFSDTDPSGLDVRWYVCPDCDGDGWNPSQDPEKPKQVQCERCVGSGRLAIHESRAGGGLDAACHEYAVVNGQDCNHDGDLWDCRDMAAQLVAYAKDTGS